jgi:hypothetical protein
VRSSRSQRGLMNLAKQPSSVIRVSDEFYALAKKISAENGIGLTDATRIIARRMAEKPEKLRWSPI